MELLATTPSTHLLTTCTRQVLRLARTGLMLMLLTALGWIPQTPVAQAQEVCYVVPDGQNTLRSLIKATGVETLIGDNNVDGIEAIALSPDGSMLWNYLLLPHRLIS